MAVAALLLLVLEAHESVRPCPIEEALASAPPRSAPVSPTWDGGGRTAFGGFSVALVGPVPGGLLTAVVWPNHCTPSPRCSKMRVVVPVFLSRHTPSRAKMFGPPASNCFGVLSAGVPSECAQDRRWPRIMNQQQRRKRAQRFLGALVQSQEAGCLPVRLEFPS